jgi:glycogen synthase
MNILFVATELAPHAKVGGLADVMAALPQALAKAGHGVSLVVPLHRGLRRSGEFRRTEAEIEVPGSVEGKVVRIWEGERGGVSLFALERDEYFDRAQLYGEGGVDYPDSLERFSFLARGAVELAISGANASGDSGERLARGVGACVCAFVGVANEDGVHSAQSWISGGVFGGGFQEGGIAGRGIST